MKRFLQRFFRRKEITEDGGCSEVSQLKISQLKISQEPDTPLSFGYKICWLVVKSDSPEEVVEKIGGKNVCVANWESGFRWIYESNDFEKVFVTPCLEGYVLVLNVEDLMEHEEFLEMVAGKFEEVQYFASHRTVDLYGWAKYFRGKMVRRYYCCLGNGDMYWDDGQLTEEEKELGLTNLPNEVMEDWDECTFADEEMVMEIARRWGVDTELGKFKGEKSTGFLCEIEYEV